MSNKRINREAFRAVMPRIWQTNMDIEVVRDNTFLFYFCNHGDRFRVLAGGPWCFDNCLLVLEKVLEMGSFLGQPIGDLVDIDDDKVVVGEMSTLNTSLGESDKSKQRCGDMWKHVGNSLLLEKKKDNVSRERWECAPKPRPSEESSSWPSVSGIEKVNWSCEELDVLPIPSSDGPNHAQQIMPIHSFEAGLHQVVLEGPNMRSEDGQNLDQAQQIMPFYGDHLPISIGGRDWQVGKMASPSSQSKNRVFETHQEVEREKVVVEFKKNAGNSKVLLREKCLVLMLENVEMTSP
ncbi:hypothetical protein EZV62_008409 [Acer yangbiense]|uniref:DUF4283 domain-containing protein n=1 Tax=Acer yangbiense TaxID=1000413 RepID=A0A5C7IDK1_9ROSI|nr:hypothetical protein EZV62_008409 [Acer yangbiense]